ncbi:MAG: hypothetical protein J6J51_05235 [Clostridia bacterium]|nr:hypothetical protein [Clostridia bacterium]
MRLKFWLKQGFEIFLLILGASMLYGFLMFIQTDSGLDGLLILLPLYLIMFGALMMMGMSIGIYKMAVPLAISFGSTRNEVLLGLQIFRIIPILLIPALAALLTAVSGEPATLPLSAVFPLGIGAFLITSALGAVIGVIFTKYGKVATIITVISIFFVAFGAGFLAAFTEDNGFLAGVTFSGKLPWLVLAVGLFLYSISMIPEQRTVWKCNVKL